MNPYPSTAPDPSQARQAPEGIALVRALDVQWHFRSNVITADAKTYGYGFGSEYVYGYTFPTYIEMAQLKQQSYYRIKVGSAIGDPIERIWQQFAASKTAISELPTVLLIFQTMYANHLERWLHRRLQQAKEAGGSEWFETSPKELLELFEKYVLESSTSRLESANDASKVARFTETQESKTRTVKRKPKVQKPLSKKSREGHAIQAVMEASPKTVAQIIEECAKIGIEESRVKDHIDFEMNIRKRAYINEQGHVIVTRFPKWRRSEAQE